MHAKSEMKYIFFGIAILLMVSTQVFAGTFKNEPDGFRGIKWGTNIKEVEGMKFIGADETFDGRRKVYFRNNDELKIGTAQLSKIEYYFFDDLFLMVYIRFSGFLNWLSLKDMVFERYGKYNDNTSKRTEEFETYQWVGNTAMAHLFYSYIDQTGYLHIMSRSISEKVSDYIKERAKKGSEKGF